MILSNTSGVLLVCIVYSELGVRRARGSAYRIAEDDAVRLWLMQTIEGPAFELPCAQVAELLYSSGIRYRLPSLGIVAKWFHKIDSRSHSVRA